MSEKNNAAVYTAEKPAEVCGFTPGPWRVSRQHIPGTDGVHVSNGKIILACLCGTGAAFGTGYGDIDANARLIAAAPELYAALSELVDLAEALAQRDYGDGYDNCVDEAFGAQCDNAIIKARAALALVRTAS